MKISFLFVSLLGDRGEEGSEREIRLSTGHSWGLALVSSLLTGLHWAALGTDPAH